MFRTISSSVSGLNTLLYKSIISDAFAFATIALPSIVILSCCYLSLTPCGVGARFHLSITTQQPSLSPSFASEGIPQWPGSISYLYPGTSSSSSANTNGNNYSELSRDQLSNLTRQIPPPPNVAEELTNDLETWKAPYVLRKNFPYYLAGYDDEDRPIWVAEFGKFNIRKVVEDGPEMMRLLDKYTNQAFYRIIKSIEERNREGNEVKEAMFLVDFDGLSLYQVSHLQTAVYTIKLARRYSYLLNNYMGGAIIVNANYLAVRLLNFLRPLQGRAFERIDIYGTNRAQWIPRVRRMFPPEALPIWYGGTKNFVPLKIYG